MTVCTKETVENGIVEGGDHSDAKVIRIRQHGTIHLMAQNVKQINRGGTPWVNGQLKLGKLLLTLSIP